MADRRTRKRKWPLVVLAIALLLAVCTTAVLYPNRPFAFLRGAELQTIEVIDADDLLVEPGKTAPAGAPPKLTYKVYTSQMEHQQLVSLVRKELSPADGWTAKRMGDLTSFTRGHESVVVQPTDSSNKNLPALRQEIARAGESVVVLTVATDLADRIVEKINPDR